MTTGTREGSALVEDLLQQIGKTVGDKATVSTVFGDAVERQGVTVIPVARARFGFGGGGGEGGRGNQQGSGGGGGGGVLVTPIGYIEVHDGTAHFKRIFSSFDLVALAVAASVAAVAVKRLLSD